MKAVRDLDALQARIGYRFKNLALLEQALTHTTGARPSDGLQSYQRLEWLGDRVLGLAIAEALLAAFPDAAEGDMSIRFAELVRKETCAEVAIAWGVGPNIRLGAGEATSGVRKRVTVLGDACEAIVGAVFLDADYPASKAVVLVGWRDRLAGAAAIRRAPKAELQELAMGRALGLPVYSETGRSGPAHRMTFTVAVEVPTLGIGHGEGSSKREAEQAAAAALLAQIAAGDAAPLSEAS